MPLRETLQTIEQLLDAGDVSAAVDLRGQLMALCTQAKADDPLGCFGRARAADLALMMLERQAADHILEPYLDGTAAKPCKALVEKLEELPRAAIKSVCSNALYRHRRYDAANDLIDEAIAHFDDLGGETSPRAEVQVGRMWSLAYAARIAWRASADARDVESYAERCMRAIEHNRRISEVSAQRLASLEAFVSDLRAFTRWLLGDISSAMASCYRGLALLGGQRVVVKDHARRGQALLTAGRIHATLSDGDRYRDAYDLLEEAAHEFKTVKHPLRELAEIERVRLVIRSRDRRLMDSEIKSLNRSDSDPVLAAEYDLTQCWLAQAGRKKNPENSARQQLENAQRIVDASTVLPRRLTLEGRLQLGMALAAGGDFEKGIAELKSLQSDARRLRRERLEAACLLELADASSRIPDQRGEAQGYFVEASQIIARAGSPYLVRRQHEVERRLHIGWLHHVKTDRYQDELSAFNRRFFNRAMQLYNTKRNVARVTRAAYLTVNKWVDKDERPSRVGKPKAEAGKGKVDQSKTVKAKQQAPNDTRKSTRARR